MLTAVCCQVENSPAAAPGKARQKRHPQLVPQQMLCGAESYASVTRFIRKNGGREYSRDGKIARRECSKEMDQYASNARNKRGIKGQARLSSGCLAVARLLALAVVLIWLRGRREPVPFFRYWEVLHAADGQGVSGGGIVCHVINRGNARNDVFHQADD